jgi:hypothetical protein
MGRGIGYLLNNLKALTRFLEDGRIPIDNGVVERLHVRAATRGSLCVTPSSTWKPKNSLARRIATRATTMVACA